MFEIIIAFVGVLLIEQIPNPYIQITLFIPLLAIILPGLYATLFGAPFLPSKDVQITKIMKLANAKKSDNIVDLGCGEGRLLRAFHKKDFKNLTGYEFSIPTYIYAKFRNLGLANIRYQNFWQADLSKQDIILCFLLTHSMRTFHKKIWPKLKPGTKVVSSIFPIKELKPDKSLHGVYLYIKK